MFSEECVCKPKLFLLHTPRDVENFILSRQWRDGSASIKFLVEFTVFLVQHVFKREISASGY